MKLMGWVCRNVYGVTRLHNRLPAPKYYFQLAFEKDERLFETVAMRGRAASWRNVRINDTELPGCVVSCDADGVSIADKPYVRQTVDCQAERESGCAWDRPAVTGNASLSC